MFESLCVGLYTAERMRAVDAAAIEGLGIPGGHLMERAGVAVAREIMLAFEPDSVVIYAGKGNNGGDGFVVARELVNGGVDVLVCAVAGRDDYKGDALLNLEIAEQLGIEIVDGVEPCDDADVVVDAVFGTGFSGVARGRRRRGDRGHERLAGGGRGARHRLRRRRLDAARSSGPAVLADLTVALHAPKVGHFVSPGFEHAGHVVVVPIGIPPECDGRARRLRADRRGGRPARACPRPRSTTSARSARWPSSAVRAA